MITFLDLIWWASIEKITMSRNKCVWLLYCDYINTIIYRSSKYDGVKVFTLVNIQTWVRITWKYKDVNFYYGV